MCNACFTFEYKYTLILSCLFYYSNKFDSLSVSLETIKLLQSILDLLIECISGNEGGVGGGDYNPCDYEVEIPMTPNQIKELSNTGRTGAQNETKNEAS